MKDYDWGTTVNEPFSEYFKRIEDQIDECIANDQSYPIYIVIDIFKQQVWNPNAKMADVYDGLKRILKREPVVDDLNAFIDYIKDRLINRTKRGFNPKYLLDESKTNSSNEESRNTRRRIG